MKDLRTYIQPWMMRTLTADAGAGEGGGGGAGGAGAGGEGAGGAGAGGAGEGSASPFWETFSDAGLKDSASVQKFKTPEELAHAFVGLEKRFGIDPARRIDLPADPNDAKAMREVYAKLGLPEKADGYGLTLDDKASDADKALLGAFTAKAHELGLPAGMAKGVMAFWMDQVKATQDAEASALAQRATDGKAALVKEFGAAFETRTREIGKLVEKYGDAALVEALKGDNLLSYPGVASMLGKLLDRMAEPGAAGGEAGDGAQDGRALTPAQAKAAVAALEADPVKGKALSDKQHPQHRAVVEERIRLLAMTEPKAA